MEMIIINRVFDSRYEIYLEIALTINKRMYDDGEISYIMYNAVEKEILEKIKQEREKNSGFIQS